MPRGQAHYVGPEVVAPSVEATYVDGSDEDHSGILGHQGGGGSPTSASQVSRSKLDMHDHDLKRIETEVREHIRKQNSLKQEE